MMRAAAAAVFVSCAAVVAPSAFGQQAYSPPRTADGHPDLGGVWSNADEDVTISQTVDGKVQTFPFVEPTTQHLPFRDRAAIMEWRDKYGVYMGGKPMPEFTQGVDTLPNRDRCLMAANAAAPPMTSQGYNDAYEIVQTPSVIVISVEMMDETRIVPMFASADEARKAHGPWVLQRWTGDSVGWWEGDTLVVETTNVRVQQASQSPYPTSKDGKAIERFTRTGKGELHYHAEIIDPVTYTRPWSIENRFHPTKRLWEYACHEGNYGLYNLLSGERAAERRTTKGKR